MKNLQFILFLIIFSIYISEEQDFCSSNFDENLHSKCNKIAQNCKNEDGLGCFLRGCSNAQDSTSCYQTLPDNTKINTHKCHWGRTGTENQDHCYDKPKECSDYNKFANVFIPNGGDTCSSLYAGDDQKCLLINEIVNGCEPRTASCQLFSSSQCGLYPIADNANDCEWSNDRNQCVPKKKNCEGTHLFLGGGNQNICANLDPSDTNKICIHFNLGCKEVFKTCEEYKDPTKTDAENKLACEKFDLDSTHQIDNMPVIGNIYDLSKKCVWNKKTKTCISETRKCTDYNSLLTNDICENLKPKNNEIQTCISKTVGGTTYCYEKYTSCEDYGDNTPTRNRDSCEDSLSLIDSSKKCDYIYGEFKCKTKETYTKCTDYPGKDRLICESIRTTNHPYYCVLNKDNECIERELICSEVDDEDDCLHIAKASDPNKKCAFKNNECVEEYIRCEDYIPISSLNPSSPSPSDICTNIKLYNGLKCEYDYDTKRCRTIKKECIDATTKDECKLIAKTGVSDPERKVCQWRSTGVSSSSGSCNEVFKYCSDYRLDNTNSINDCQYINPYDQEGENIDELSKCVFEQGTSGQIHKCQKIPKDCNDANGNAILCSKISPYIKNNHIQYCRYDKIAGTCDEQYKTCDSFKETNEEEEVGSLSYNNNKQDCENIIPEKYEDGSCSYELDKEDYKYKCVISKECKLFDTRSISKTELCYLFQPNCVYEGNDKCTTDTEIECKNIKFYSGTDEENQNYCKNITATKPYKICTLREDKSGCEEIYKDISFSTAASSYKEPPGSQSQESSEMIKGIQLIVILLCLLF